MSILISVSLTRRPKRSLALSNHTKRVYLLMTAMREAYYRVAEAYRKNGDTLMMRRYLEIFLKRAKDVPYLQEQVRTAEQML